MILKCLVFGMSTTIVSLTVQAVLLAQAAANPVEDSLGLYSQLAEKSLIFAILCIILLILYKLFIAQLTGRMKDKDKEIEYLKNQLDKKG